MVALFYFPFSPSTHHKSPRRSAPYCDCQGGYKYFRSCRYPSAQATSECPSSACRVRALLTRRSDADRGIEFITSGAPERSFSKALRFSLIFIFVSLDTFICQLTYRDHIQHTTKARKSPAEVLKYSTFFDIIILIRPTNRLKRNLSL